MNPTDEPIDAQFDSATRQFLTKLALLRAADEAAAAVWLTEEGRP